MFGRGGRLAWVGRPELPLAKGILEDGVEGVVVAEFDSFFSALAVMLSSNC
jgi:hypothetical protein